MGLTQHEKFKLSQLQAKKAQRNKAPKFRTFVNISNGNDKFWKISAAYFSDPYFYTVVTQYGANGTDGVEIKKEFYYLSGASNYIEAKIREKLNKGYEEI